MGEIYKELENGIRICVGGASTLLRRYRIVLRSIISGLVAVTVDISFIYFFTEQVGLWYLHSSVLAYTLSIIISFFLQKYWAFSDASITRIPKQFFLFVILAIWNLVFNTSLVYVFVEFASFGYIYAQISSGIIIGVLSFVIYAAFLFRTYKRGDKAKVLIATPIFPPDAGGPATHVKNVLDGLIKQGFDVGIITFGDNNNDFEESECVNVHRVKRYPWLIKNIVYLFWLFIHSFNYDLVFAQDANATGLPALLVKIFTRRRFILRIGGDFLWEMAQESGQTKSSFLNFYKNGEHKKFFIYWLDKIILGEAEKVIVPSEILFDTYIKYYGVKKSNLEIIKNPFIDSIKKIDFEFDPNKEKKILFAGRFVGYKNIDILINAFCNVYEKIKPARLTIVGEGPFKNKYIELARNSKVSDRIVVADRVSREGVRSLINKTSLCVGPAKTEFNPNFILECLSSGKPAIVSGENGLSVELPEEFLFNSDNQTDLENKILFFFNNEKRMLQEIENVVELAPKNSWEDVVKRYIDIFNS